MRKQTTFETAYNALARIESAPIDEVAIASLRQAMNSNTSLLVSLASDIAARQNIHDLIPDMVSAFNRFMINGAKIDKQCNAKISIVNALNSLGYMGDDVFPAGACYIQMEPAYGGPSDTAVEVRTGSAYGLARTNHTDAVYILTDLLVDEQPGVRAAAVRALSYIASSECEHLIRLKSLTGDSEPQVIGECYESLMTMSPNRSLDFVCKFLRSENPSIVQYAAIAIGGSRMPEAYEKLRECWDDNPSPSARQVLLLPIALVRSNESLNFLVEVVRTGERRTAAETISILTIYSSEGHVTAIKEAVKSRCDAKLLDHFRSVFGN